MGEPRVLVPEGFELRAPRSDEVEAVATLIAETEAAITPDVPPETTPGDVESEWRGLDMERDHWVLVGDDGRLAAYAALYEQGDDYPLADGYVHPSAWGLGLGSCLVDVTEREARRRLAASGRSELRLHNGVAGSDEAARSVLRSRGYEPARHFYRMAIALPARLPAGRAPADIVISTMHPDQRRAVHTVIEEGFSQEWGHSPESFEAWKDRKDKEGWDPDLCFVAMDGRAEIVGVCQCSKRYGGGWVNALAVLAPHRGRGLGTALLVAALRDFQERGETRVALGVDAQGSTGATRVYEKAGMTVEWDAIIFEKVLRSSRR